ncbi:MAG: hypothetical protein IKF36_01595 [Bacilli bacterium]|nr:hypothetical protein [Bacilli bacterium]
MRKISNKKFDKKTIKELIFRVALVTALATGFTACGKNNTNNSGTEVVADASTKVSEKPEEVITEKETEKTTEATSETKKELVGSLNVEDNASIEATVDTIYNDNKEFYEKNAIDKDTIRDMIFVINDKYTDEDGNVIIDNGRIDKASAAIDTVMYSDTFRQKIDNVNTKEFDVDKFECMSHPSLTKYVDLNLAGSKALVEEIEEYETVRDHEIDVMNKTGETDLDAIYDYVIKQEVTDINYDSNNIGSFAKNGQKYVAALTHVNGLRMAAAMNNHTIYLEAEVYGNIETVKINFTQDERDLNATVETLMREGLITEENYENAVSYVEVAEELNLTDEEMAKQFSNKYYISLNDSNLLIAYAKNIMKMEVTGWNNIACTQIHKAKQAIESKTTSLNGAKKLFYSA